MTNKRHPNAPTHACPFLAAAAPSPHTAFARQGLAHTATAAERRVLEWLQRGAHVLLDLKVRRALLVHAASGLKPLMEITTRMLALLVQRGRLVCVGRMGRVIQYRCAPV